MISKINNVIIPAIAIYGPKGKAFLSFNLLALIASIIEADKLLKIINTKEPKIPKTIDNKDITMTSPKPISSLCTTNSPIK